MAGGHGLMMVLCSGKIRLLIDDVMGIIMGI